MAYNKNISVISLKCDYFPEMFGTAVGIKSHRQDEEFLMPFDLSLYPFENTQNLFLDKNKDLLNNYFIEFGKLVNVIIKNEIIQEVSSCIYQI